MKKLLIVLLALTVVGIFAVAEDAPASISIGGWGRMWFNPIHSYGSGDAVADAGPGWANGGGRVGVGFNGSSSNVGFSWNPGVSNSKMTAVCDQAKIWVKINPMIQLQLGKIQGDVLRGKLDDFGDILPVDGKDNIFKRFYPANGMLLDITPMDGVYLGVALDAAAAVDNSGIRDFAKLAIDADDTITDKDAAKKAVDAAFPDVPVTAENMFKAIQIGGGYVIPNLGHFRAQYIGNPESKLAKAQVAFAYTGMEGLLIDTGITIPFDTKVGGQMLAVVAASYSKDALSAYGRVDAKFLGPKGADKFNTDFAAQVYYTVQAPIAVGVETALTGMSAAGSDFDSKTLDVYPVVKLGYSNGYLKVGFDYKAGLDDQDAQYALPIQMEYWF